MNPSEIKLSIALLTRNSSENLEQALDCLNHQSVAPHEIIISDDSNDLTAIGKNKNLAEKYGATYQKGPKKGLYANRNSAALACTGTHIRTMDDDHTFPKNHLETCIQSVASDPQVVWTTGEVGYIDKQLYSTIEVASQLDPSGYSRPALDPDNNWAIADGSTIYPKSVFDAGYRYIEHFNYGASYLEFGIFLYKHNFRSRCIPNCKVDHWAPPETVLRIKDHSLPQMLSRAYAIIAYNRYFKPSTFLMWKYLTAVFVQTDQKIDFLKNLPSLFKKVSLRWVS